MPETPSWSQDAIVTVGHGRGFLVKAQCGVVVVTAAHCLPKVPQTDPHPDSTERICPGKLLGQLGKKATVRAECLFADPVEDIAVLRELQGHEFTRQADAYAVWSVTDQRYASAGQQGSPVPHGYCRVLGSGPMAP